MVDLSNKIENKLESKEINNLEETLDNIPDFEKQSSTSDDSPNNSQIIIDGESSSNITEEIVDQHSDLDKDSSIKEVLNSEVVNCLALTVKKDYNLSIVKNIMFKTLKNFWRIAVSVFTLNFLKYFL